MRNSEGVLTREKLLESSPFSEEAFSLAFSKKEAISDLPEEPLSFDALREAFPGIKKRITELEDKTCTYTYKQELVSSLSIIGHRVRELKVCNSQSGDLEKILAKIGEEANSCFQGLHDRAEEIILSFQLPKNFSELLQLVREDLVGKAAASLTAGVHAANTITCIAAQELKLGVRARNTNGEFYGELTKYGIQRTLLKTFREQYTIFNIPFLLCDFLKTQVTAWYVGPKKPGDPSNKKNHDEFLYKNGEIENILAVLHTYLPNNSEGPWSPYLITDAESFFTKDINWLAIQKVIFEKLKAEYCKPSGFQKPRDLNELAIAFLFEEKIDEETINKLIEDFKKDSGNSIPILIKNLSQNPTAFCAFLENEKISSEILPLIKLSSLLGNLIEKIPVKTLIATDLKAAEEGIYKGKGKNGFRFWMRALLWAADKNDATAVSNMTTALSELIDKMNTDQINSFITNLSRAAGEDAYKGANGFWLWMCVLLRAVEKNNATAVSNITTALSELIGKMNTDQINNLIIGLSKAVEEDVNKGTNGFWLWMGVLSGAVEKNNSTAVSNITTALSKLIDKMNTDQINNLIIGLSKAAEEDVNKGKNGFRFWMGALSWATEKNNATAVSNITTALSQLIGKMNTDQINSLITGLSKVAEGGVNKGTNGFWLWMDALSRAAEKNNVTAVSNITTALSELIDKMNTDQVNSFITNLSEAAEESVIRRTTGFWLWMDALSSTYYKNNIDASNMIATVFLKLIEKTSLPYFKKHQGIFKKFLDNSKYDLKIKEKTFFQLINNGIKNKNIEKIEIAEQFLRFSDEKTKLSLLNNENLWKEITQILESPPSSLTLPIFQIVMRLTNTHRTIKPSFFGERKDFPRVFSCANEAKKSYFSVFSKLIKPENQKLCDSLLADGLFLVSSNPKEYLREFCLEEMKKNTQFYDEYLSKGKPLSKLVDANRGFFKKEKTRTRIQLYNAIKMK